MKSLQLFLLFLMAGLSLAGNTGCATVGKSILLGTAAGTIAGATSGAYWGLENREKYALQAAIYTGLAGGLAGYFAHEHLEERDEQVRQETLFNLEKFGVDSGPGPSHSYSAQGTQGTAPVEGPVLMVPKVESQWVKTQVQGKKLIEGHRVWVITEDSQWPSTQKIIKRED